MVDLFPFPPTTSNWTASPEGWLRLSVMPSASPESPERVTAFLQSCRFAGSQLRQEW
jgi:hypothetical protein